MVTQPMKKILAHYTEFIKTFLFIHQFPCGYSNNNA